MADCSSCPWNLTDEFKQQMLLIHSGNVFVDHISAIIAIWTCIRIIWTKLHYKTFYWKIFYFYLCTLLRRGTPNLIRFLNLDCVSRCFRYDGDSCIMGGKMDNFLKTIEIELITNACIELLIFMWYKYKGSWVPSCHVLVLAWITLILAFVYAICVPKFLSMDGYCRSFDCLSCSIDTSLTAPIGWGPVVFFFIRHFKPMSFILLSLYVVNHLHKLKNYNAATLLWSKMANIMGISYVVLNFPLALTKWIIMILQYFEFEINDNWAVSSIYVTTVLESVCPIVMMIQFIKADKTLWESVDVLCVVLRAVCMKLAWARSISSLSVIGEAEESKKCLCDYLKLRNSSIVPVFCSSPKPTKKTITAIAKKIITRQNTLTPDRVMQDLDLAVTMFCPIPTFSQLQNRSGQGSLQLFRVPGLDTPYKARLETINTQFDEIELDTSEEEFGHIETYRFEHTSIPNILSATTADGQEDLTCKFIGPAKMISNLYCRPCMKIGRVHHADTNPCFTKKITQREAKPPIRLAVIIQQGEIDASETDMEKLDPAEFLSNIREALSKSIKKTHVAGKRSKRKCTQEVDIEPAAESQDPNVCKKELICITYFQDLPNPET